MENKHVSTIPLNLQFFADGDNGSEPSTPTTSNEPVNGNEPQGTPTTDDTNLTLEQVMSELASVKAERTKFKASIDKLTHENKELTSQLRQRMTAQEVEEAAKLEADEQQKAYVAELEAFKRKTEAKDRYMKTSGMDAETAEKAAEAEINGDMDALALIQKQHQDAEIKAKEAEWLGSRPSINAGGDNAYSHMSRDEIMAIKDPAERQRAIAMNMNLF